MTMHVFLERASLFFGALFFVPCFLDHTTATHARSSHIKPTLPSTIDHPSSRSSTTHNVYVLVLTPLVLLIVLGIIYLFMYLDATEGLYGVHLICIGRR